MYNNYISRSELRKQNRTLKIVCVILSVLVVAEFLAILNLKDGRDYYRAGLYAEQNDCEWVPDSFGNYNVCK